jgi:hypothetical protein
MQASPANAYTYTWSEVVHNIEGAYEVAAGSKWKAEYFWQSVDSAQPFAATAVEVCQNQANAIYNELISTYHVYFNIAKASDSDCPDTGNGRAFGNVIVITKAADVTFSTSLSGFQASGTESSYSLIFDHQASSVEHKRIDCPDIALGTTTTHKFSVCSTHLARASSGYADDQFVEFAVDPDMGAPSMFMGDFNLEPEFMDAVVYDWRWDRTNPFQATVTDGRKVDWVLGREDGNFTRTSQSQVYGYGSEAAYYSDHKLLHALVKP